jgi:hypothetical protein
MTAASQQVTGYMPDSVADHVAAAAATALLAELETWPKPGLVTTWMRAATQTWMPGHSERVWRQSGRFSVA